MTTVKGAFLLRGTNFEVEIQADPVDVCRVGVESALRMAFVHEAQRRLGGVCLNDWKFLRDSVSVDFQRKGIEK